VGLSTRDTDTLTSFHNRFQDMTQFHKNLTPWNWVVLAIVIAAIGYVYFRGSKVSNDEQFIVLNN